jgi:hypothetical protein
LQYGKECKIHENTRIMAFKKGNSGKPKGSQNKLTKTVKEAFEIAFNELQSDKKANLATWAKENTTDFYRLAAKLIPTSLNADLTSKGEEIKQWNVVITDGSKNQ